MHRNPPTLRSFFLWCGVGILAVYMYQVAFFVACLSLDCRRLRSYRNGLCPCYVHKSRKDQNEETRTTGDEGEVSLGLAQKSFQFVSKIILSMPGRLAVLLLSSALLGCGIWQATELKQEFQSIWFLPPTSYLRQWFEASEE